MPNNGTNEKILMNISHSLNFIIAESEKFIFECYRIAKRPNARYDSSLIMLEQIALIHEYIQSVYSEAICSYEMYDRSVRILREQARIYIKAINKENWEDLDFNFSEFISNRHKDYTKTINGDFDPFGSWLLEDPSDPDQLEKVRIMFGDFVMHLICFKKIATIKDISSVMISGSIFDKPLFYNIIAGLFESANNYIDLFVEIVNGFDFIKAQNDESEKQQTSSPTRKPLNKTIILSIVAIIVLLCFVSFIMGTYSSPFFGSLGSNSIEEEGSENSYAYVGEDVPSDVWYNGTGIFHCIQGCRGTQNDYLVSRKQMLSEDKSYCRYCFVYISNSGKCYHMDPFCSGMDTPTLEPIYYAEEHGYEPCEKCYH